MRVNNFQISDFPELSTYTQYQEKIGLSYDDNTTTEHIHAKFFERNVHDKTVSVGVFYYGEMPLFCAWGYKDDVHCGYHAVMGEHGTWLPPQLGCPIKVPIKSDTGENIGLMMPTGTTERRFLFQ